MGGEGGRLKMDGAAGLRLPTRRINQGSGLVAPPMRNSLSCVRTKRLLSLTEMLAEAPYLSCMVDFLERSDRGILR